MANPSKDQMRLMMQSLLAERFKLAVHFETHDVPVMALVLVEPGKLGFRLRPHSQGPPCDAKIPPVDHNSPKIPDVWRSICGDLRQAPDGTRGPCGLPPERFRPDRLRLIPQLSKLLLAASPNR